TGTAVSEVDTSNLLLQKRMPPPECASLISNLDEKEAALLDEDLEGEDSAGEEEPAVKYMCQDKDFLFNDRPGFHDSPVADFSGHELDNESHLSESSDRMSDFESASLKNEEEVVKVPLTSLSPSSSDGATTGPDSLEQMKAIYTSFLTNSYWSSLNFNLTQPPASAVAKTLQQVSQNQNRLIHPAAEQNNLFSTVQLYRQSTKLYGSIFTGASKFRCKDCSAAYDTLVGLTVHMNETGHYRDDNHETDSDGTKRWSKPRKRSLLEMEGKEDAQKVLKCMYCGHSFESLQDLSVHMIKTKHYQKVPLKEPVTPVAAKIFSSARKRAPIELDLPSSPDSNGGTPKTSLNDHNDPLQKASNPYITPNNRYGHQNGASYAWQFESRKSQILKCMECGSSHDTLQELTAHMMVTGHFIKVTNSAIKKGKPIMESPPPPVPTISAGEEKFQSVPLAATAFSPPPAPIPPPSSVSPAMAVEIKKEEKEEECMQETTNSSKDKKTGDDETEEKFDISSKYSYLTEEDLEESPKGGFDILKSLENTVTSAINKAQNGAPSWGGYPSIHAAYQLPNIMKLSLANSGKSSALKYMFPGGEILSQNAKNQPLISPPSRQTSPLPKNNFHAMEELVKKVTEKVAKVEEKMREPNVRASPLRRTTPSPCSSEAGESARGESPKERRGSKTPESIGGGSHKDSIITDHPPEQPFVNPLSALQSVMNVHLGKAAKPALPSLDPMSMLFKMSNSLAEKAAVAASTPAQTKKNNEHLDRYFYHVNNDQPIDLTKGKNEKTTMAKASSAVASFMSNSPLRENALSDISDMLRNLTESQASKSSTPTSLSERSDIEGSTQEELEEISPAQKRKGRQSNWNPQHLHILQAQFAASLRQTGDGKYVMSDLSPQERMHISRFTGLSMTTISHWLANVKYQLRRTGGRKPGLRPPSVLLQRLCFSDPFPLHLRQPLGVSPGLQTPRPGQTQLVSQISRHTKSLSEKLLSNHSNSHSHAHSPSPSPDEDGSSTSYHKHAVKLHLSKTHGKSPEDHLMYVCELEKQ
ncbi:unnamed protein product, partial [Oncorhynchus mykiss]